jgi:hypothetical protein
MMYQEPSTGRLLLFPNRFLQDHCLKRAASSGENCVPWQAFPRKKGIAPDFDIFLKSS